MALLFWKRLFWTPTQEELDRGIGADAPVSDQHPLPTTPTWQAEGDTEHAPVDEGHPLPVQLHNRTDGLWVSRIITLAPQTNGATPYTAGDAVGGVMSLGRDRNGMLPPARGMIHVARLFDPDDDTLSFSLYVFNALPQGVADNAAFSLSAADNEKVVAVVPLTATTDVGSAKWASYTNIGEDYYSPSGLWVQGFTAGTPTIAAGVMPKVQVYIIPLDGWR